MKSSGLYRFCTVILPGMGNFIDKSKAPSTDRPYYEGPAASTVNFMIEMTFKGIETNWTIVESTDLGTKTEEGFTGCLASLINNESDTAVGYVDYPTDDFEHIVPYQIENQFPTEFITGYSTCRQLDQRRHWNSIHEVLHAQRLLCSSNSHDFGITCILCTSKVEEKPPKILLAFFHL